MAKKLMLGNYEFDPAEKLVKIKGNIAPEKVLLITNITDNQLIYNFADPTIGYSGKSYNPNTNETLLVLKANTAPMSSTDILQIFVDEPSTEITPAEDLIDPVGKLRISDPQNLIDTDFEYGLQGTKWETSQQIANIPTIFSNSGDTPIDGIQSAMAIAGSKAIEVSCSIAHGLTVGDPIAVNGMTTYTAEGFFIVTNVPNSTTFFFEADVASPISGDVSGSYTSITSGKFFEGSTLLVNTSNGAVTDSAANSSINVTTEETHGLTEGTKIYLRNTVGPKTLFISDSEATAPDGRPVVDTVEKFVSNIAVTSTSTDRVDVPIKEKSTIGYDWEPTYSMYFDPANWNNPTNQIYWQAHELRDNYTLLFSTPTQGDTDGGLDDGYVYHVKKIDADYIELYTDSGLTSQASLATLQNTQGPARLGLVYKIESADGVTRSTAFGVAAAQMGSGFTIDVWTNTSGQQLGSNSTSAVTHKVNVTQVLGGNPTNCKIDSLKLAGDTDYSGEWVDVTIGSTTSQIYSPGNQNSSFSNINTTVFNNLTVDSLLYVDTDGDTKFDMTTFCSYAVGNFTMGGQFRYMVQLELSTQVTGAGYTEEQLNNSGSDFYESGLFGLGAAKPSVLIGFQGRSPGNYSNSNDQFSYLTNQRINGRYGTINRQYNTQVDSTSNDGSFIVDYTQSASTYGTGSEIYYVFANVLAGDRNTVYLPGHGIPAGQEVTLTADPTNYTNGQRFGFADGSGNPITLSQNNIQCTVQVINQDVIRMSSVASPQTDDLIKWPETYYIGYERINPTWNTIYSENHKIQGDALANYSVGNGNPISPLTTDTQYTVKRFDDHRFSLVSSGGGAPTVITTDDSTTPGTSQNSLQTFFLDIETIVGYAPASATINNVLFRGDFGSTSEYCVLGIGAQTWVIGQYDGSDTATWRTSNTFPGPVNVTADLTTQGGKVGFSWTCDPTPAVNFSAGISQGWWWQFRFEVEVSAPGAQIFTDQGTLDHTFEVINLVGAYDGVFTLSNVPTPQTFEMQSDFQIPERLYAFGAADVNGTDDIITFTDPHNMITGEQLEYNSQLNTSILPAGANNTVYAISTGINTIKLATSPEDALNNFQLDLNGQSGEHILRSDNVIKAVQGGGSLNIANNSLVIKGVGSTNFLSNFKRYDPIFINTGEYVEQFTVDQITTPNTMTLFANVANLLTDTVSETDYFYASQLAMRPDGFVLHKPFDGGVDMTAGTSPNSKIVRQTRKYFRYQSGKGIQTSVAINFNPPRIVSDLIKASGSIATVNTQEQHNLNVGDTVIIKDAIVDSGFNYYNGTFLVQSTPTPFQFTYNMIGQPGNVKAQGFPTYVRDSWTDSFVRTGMFDDQNGFFWEFDGQKLYAVRRSSTKQLAGTVNVSVNSQVVTGQDCSFTTQVVKEDKIVIRGQTYRVVEVSSDTKMVIQPAYKGVSANRVKATLTVDVRTPQDQWNIDKADGTGFTGFILDTKKIQMAYIDYSWYGAGKIRYGFKDGKGHIRYFHEYIHNNILDESYFRSGNLPARYEIENGTNATTAPTLFHFGTSVIMDGKFDDDKAYQFTGQSKPFAFTQGQSRIITSTAVSGFEQITLDGNRVWVYSIQVSQTDASATTVGQAVSEGTTLPVGTYISQVKVDGASSKIYLNYPATSSNPDGGGVYDSITSGSAFILGESASGINLPVDLTRPLPLISIRLAPSVDSSLTGKMGEREVINRMQLKLISASITVNQDAEVFLIQNPLPSEMSFVKAQNPSLSEVLKHSSGDTLLNGTTIYSSKVSTGSSTFDIGELMEMGNSILGGDGIFPAGPDLLTLAVQPQDTSRTSESQPFFTTGKISWSESQA